MPDTPASWPERLAALPWPAALTSGARRAAAAALVVAAAAVAGAVALVAVRGAPPAPETTLPMAGSPSAVGAGTSVQADRGTEASEVYVHVAGAVARPGVYRVRPGGRVADVVDAAGGPSGDADVDQLNLAAKVGDGERVYVPRRGEVVPVAAGGAGAESGGAVDLNTATLEQLDDLPGVGPATAQAILDYRQEHGRFGQVQELLEVRGIGEAKLADLRARVRV